MGYYLKPAAIEGDTAIPEAVLESLIRAAAKRYVANHGIVGIPKLHAEVEDSGEVEGVTVTVSDTSGEHPPETFTWAELTD
jgi:hypothetical protein